MSIELFNNQLGCLHKHNSVLLMTGDSNLTRRTNFYKNGKISHRSSVSKSNHTKIRRTVCTGAEKTDDCWKREIQNYPAILSFSGEQNDRREKIEASVQAKLVNLTIDGIDEDDIPRLETQLKEINGVLDVWFGPFSEDGIRGGSVIVNLHVEASTSSLIVLSQIQDLNQQLIILPYKPKTWIWRGQRIQYGTAGCGKPVILVHGFGGNSGHFAKLVPYLADSYRVYAIDLLGFGASDKPHDAKYGPELWAELLCDFTKEFASEGAVLIGNSIGSLTSLVAAEKGGAMLFRGLVLLNCAGAMNRKGLMEENVLIRLLSPIFIAIEYLLQKPPVANFLFNGFRKKENIRQILEQQAYRNKESVTDQLVDILHEPSTKPGATQVFVKVFTGDPGPRPEAMMASVTSPLLVLWGDSDIWTPANGPVANFFKQLSVERENVSVYSLPDVGHCPHDDRPELAASYILPFLSDTFSS